MRHGTFHGFLRATATVLALTLALFAGRAGAAEIILYDFFDFEGDSRTLNQSTPSLGALGFDNDLESFRVVSGTWRIYRDNNYQSNNGPYLEVGPGNYPNIEALGFPQDRASSVELLAAAPPPTPLPQACAADNVVSAGRGCRGCYPGTVAGPDNSRCVCAPGQPLLGRQANGDDRCGQPGGQPDQGDEQQAFCPGADQISYRQQGCLTCPENTVPNASNSRCVCAPGMINQGIDSRGQDLCILPSGPTDQGSSSGSGGGTQTVQVPAGDAWFVAHRVNGFSWRVHHAGNGLALCHVLWNNRGDRRGRVIELDSVGAVTIGTDQLCEIVMFSGDLDPAWTLSFSQPRDTGGPCASASVTQLPPGDSRGPGFLASFAGTPGLGCTVEIDTVTFTGPASGKWEDAFD